MRLLPGADSKERLRCKGGGCAELEPIEGIAKQPTMSVSAGVLIPVLNFLSDLGRAVSRLSLNREKGQALVEFVFIGPLLLFFILIVVDFGIAMDRRELVQHAVREGARRAAVADGVAEIKESTHNQSAGTLDEGNVSVCFVDRNGNRDAAAVVVLFLHSAGGLYVDQLATATFGGARIPAIAGGRGDVCPANGGGKRDVNVGRIDG